MGERFNATNRLSSKKLLGLFSMQEVPEKQIFFPLQRQKESQYNPSI